MGASNTTAEGGAGRHLGRYALVLGLGLLLAVVVATPAALVVGIGRICACTQPPDVVVQNADRGPTTVDWKLVGLSLVPGQQSEGRLVVEACESANLTLPEGTVHVILSSSTSAQEFDVQVPHTFADGPLAWKIIREGGAIEEQATGTGSSEDPLSACST